MQNQAQGVVHSPTNEAIDAGQSGPPKYPLQHEIAWLAHEKYLRRGGHEGHALDDWLEAERELKERMEKMLDRIFGYVERPTS